MPLGLGKWFGAGGEDPLGAITPDQLKVVLKSIETKYNNLKNENRLLQEQLDEQKVRARELETQLAKLVETNAELITERNSLRDELEATSSRQSEQAASRSEVQALEAALARAQDHAQREAKEAQEQFRLQRQELERELVAASEGRDRALAQLRELQALARVGEEADAPEDGVAATEIDRLQRAMAALEDQIDALKADQLQQLQAFRAADQAEVAELRKQAAGLVAERNSLAAELAELKAARIESLGPTDQALPNAEARARELIAEYERRLAELEAVQETARLEAEHARSLSLELDQARQALSTATRPAATAMKSAPEAAPPPPEDRRAQLRRLLG